MDILITGSTGLIASELIDRISDKHNLYIVSRNLLPNSKFKQIEINFEEEWSCSVLPDKIDAICHLAQSEKFREFPEKSQDIFNVNVVSTQKLLNYAIKAGCKKFVYASSGGVYGTGNQIFNEACSAKTGKELGYYLTTKLCSENLVENYSQFFETNILRLFFVYGKRQRATMLIPRLINSIREELPITLQGTDGIRINPVHVKDAVRAIETILYTKSNSIINIAGSETFTMRQIGEIIGEQLKIKPKFKIENRMPAHLVGDISKMLEMNLSPIVSFKEGIQEFI